MESERSLRASMASPVHEHPGIRFLLVELYEGSQLCLRFAGRAIVAALFILPFFAVFPGLLTGFGWAVALALSLFCVAAVLRFVLVFSFYLRYSLAQMIKVIMTGGLLVSLGFVLPWPWGIAPFSVLVLLAVLISAYVLSYDPVAPSKLIPPTAREALFNPPVRRYPRPSVVQTTVVEQDSEDLIDTLQARNWDPRATPGERHL